MGGAIGGGLVRPLYKGTKILVRGSRAPAALGGSVTAAEGVQMAGYVYGRQLATPLVRKAAAVVAVGRTYDYFTQSPESSPSSYQQGGGSGGKPSRRFKNIDALPAGSRVTKPLWKTTATHPFGGVKSGYHYCKKGWILVRVGDTNMCWKPPQKKKS